MPRLPRLLVLCACLGGLAAGEAPVVPTPPVPPTPPVVAPQGPQPALGLSIDETAATLDGGLPIKSVEAASTAAMAGIVPGDRLSALDQTPVRKPEDIRAWLATKKVGDEMSFEVKRANGTTARLAGILRERPRPGAIVRDIRELGDQVKRLQDAANREPSLAEILAMLKKIEDDLPKATAAFKKQYPDGEFSIKIQIEITSDKKAKDPLVIDASKPPPPALSATAPKAP